MASTSRAEAQRREALARLTHRCAATPPTSSEAMQLLDALPPLMSDRDAGVRTQLLKLLRTIPPGLLRQGRGGVERILGFVRAAMTDMSSTVRADAMGFLEWLLDARADLVLSCPGGWPKTLRTFIVLLGWSGYVSGVSSSSSSASAADDKGWTSAPRTTFGADRSGTAYARQIGTLTRFVTAGLKQLSLQPREPNYYWDHLWGMPKGPYPYAHLQLHLQDEYSRQYLDEDMRRDFFRRHMMGGMLKAAEETRKEAGAAGRAAGVLVKAIMDGMGQYLDDDAVDSRDIE